MAKSTFPNSDGSPGPSLVIGPPVTYLVSVALPGATFPTVLFLLDSMSNAKVQLNEASVPRGRIATVAVIMLTKTPIASQCRDATSLNCEEGGYTVCSNDYQDLMVAAGGGKYGSARQIAGYKTNPEDTRP